jgi:hypothetical protein
MWKGAFVPYFKVIFWNLQGGIEKNHEKPVRIVRLRAKI